MSKKQMRSNMRMFLQNLTDEQYQLRSEAIAERLLQDPYIIEGKTIAVTMSNRPEVDTRPIIEQLWKMGKQVVVPRCIAKTRDMVFYEIIHFEQLERVYMDILEPIPMLTKRVEKHQIDCIIVPGIVFDRSGYRIGFGGGYYDRYLADYAGVRLSLAFQEQVVDDVPKEPHDLPTQIIITENERIICNEKGFDT